MIFQKIKTGPSVKAYLSRVILTEESISYILFKIQGHAQSQKVKLKRSRKRKKMISSKLC